MESPGKIFMKQIWRFQQVGALVTIILVSLNITIPLYQYMGWRFGALGIPPNLDWLIILILFLLVFSVALLGGFFYDRVFKLWKHYQIVAVERSPFQKGRMMPTELLQWQYIYIPILLKHGLKKEALFNLKWNERNMEQDPELRKEIYRIQNWIKEYDMKGIDRRWLKEISEITKKKYEAKYGKIKPDW